MGYVWLFSLVVTVLALGVMTVGLMQERQKVVTVAAYAFWLATLVCVFAIAYMAVT